MNATTTQPSTLMKTIALLLLGLLSWPALAQDSPASPLVDKTKDLLQARKGKDASVLNQTLARDFMSVGSEGKLHDRAEMIDSVREGELQDYQAYNLRVIRVNDSTVIVTYDCIIKMPEGDAPNMAPRYQHISDLWVSEGGEWKLKFQQATPARPID
jgi:hypothetical protein